MDELKKVPTGPVDGGDETPSPASMYCRAYDSDRNVLGCAEKGTESACQAYAQRKNAYYYSYTTRSC